MASEKTVNYTAEQTALVLEQYAAGETVEAIAEAMGKSVRSIVAKLSREGVYQSKAKAAGAKRVTKADLVSAMATAIGVDASKLESMEKASMEALQLVFNAVVAAKSEVVE